jgi:hypothetical protein
LLVAPALLVGVIALGVEGHAMGQPAVEVTSGVRDPDATDARER